MNLKNIIFGIILSLLCCCNLSAQTYVDENFDSANCDDNTLDCTVINYVDAFSCLPSWAPSHGTPDAFTNNSEIGSNFQYLLDNLDVSGSAILAFDGCANAGGEGLFANIDFQLGTCYKFTLDVSTDTLYKGVLNVVATNSLTAGGITCCSSVPTTDDQEIITSFATNSLGTGHFQNWATVTFYYTPTSDFSQLWLYPKITGETGSTVVAFDNLLIERKCTDYILFDDPIVDIPVSNYQASIQITTAGGTNANYIDSDPTGNTSFKAGDLILITPNTHITVNDGNVFTMEIKDCKYEYDEGCGDDRDPGGGSDDDGGGDGDFTITTEHGNVYVTNTDRVSNHKLISDYGNGQPSTSQNAEIYPNPNDGQFTLNVPLDDNYNSTTEIIIFNQLGSIVYKTVINQRSTKLNLEHLPNGVYMVNIQLNQQPTTRRLIINK